MIVADRMTANPISIPSTASLGDALDVMFRRGIRELPVVDNDKIVGIITDRDLKMALGPDARRMRLDDIDPRQLDGNVDWFMTEGVFTVTEDTPLTEAAELILEHRIGAVPVVNDSGILSGIISATDLVRLALELLRA